MYREDFKPYNSTEMKAFGYCHANGVTGYLTAFPGDALYRMEQENNQWDVQYPHTLEVINDVDDDTPFSVSYPPKEGDIIHCDLYGKVRVTKVLSVTESGSRPPDDWSQPVMAWTHEMSNEGLQALLLDENADNYVKEQARHILDGRAYVGADYATIDEATETED